MSAIQIINYNPERKKFELDRPTLERILLDEKISNQKLVIISIAGAYRKGKSFMLDFFLRYLNSTSENDDWLGADTTPLVGFSWRGGHRRHTTGIWIWSKIFPKTLSGGEQVGVMLMDTQGMFDTKSAMNENITIFSLSTLLSSIQIYNVSNNIQEDGLRHLQLFSEYGKLMHDQSSEKAFQKLLFLVRDWSSPYEAPYGYDGGRQILDRILQIQEDTDEELANVRRHLKLSFDKIDCFLMPYPGRVATASQHFTGQLKEIDDEFIEQLKKLITGLLTPNNLLAKYINGLYVTGQNLVSYIQTYFELFESGRIVHVDSIHTATVMANNLSAKDEAFMFYCKTMEIEVGPDKPFIDAEILLSKQNKAMDDARSKFRTNAILGGNKIQNEYLSKLDNEMDNFYSVYIEMNMSKKIKSLEEIAKNLEAQIVHVKSTVDTQTMDISRLQQEMERYRGTLASEKEKLQIQINQTRELKATIDALKNKIPNARWNIRFH